jgi:hypothetical protein
VSCVTRHASLLTRTDAHLSLGPPRPSRAQLITPNSRALQHEHAQAPQFKHNNHHRAGDDCSEPESSRVEPTSTASAQGKCSAGGSGGCYASGTKREQGAGGSESPVTDSPAESGEGGDGGDGFCEVGAQSQQAEQAVQV